jgi:small subunit ribosomal protein S1
MDRNGNLHSQQRAAPDRKVRPAFGADPFDYQAPPPPDEAYWAALLSDEHSGPDDGSSGGPDVEPWASRSAVHDPASGHPPTVDGSAAAGAGTGSDWDAVEAIYAADKTFELTVVGFNRGGLLVEWHTLRGFVPASQLVNVPGAPASQTYRQHMTTYLNQALTLRIIELDRHHNRLILSERAAQVRPGSRASVMDSLRPGDTALGRVTNLCDFGAFVDLGGVEGLIHISELSWGRVSHPRDLLKRGEEVRVFVMEVHRDAGRVALSIKRLQPDPWANIEARYQIGQMIEGVITNIVDFGAFASVEEGLEGLIHVSELAEGHFLHPRNVVREGDRIQARILNIDGRGRRLGLSLRETVDPVNGSANPTEAHGEA